MSVENQNARRRDDAASSPWGTRPSGPPVRPPPSLPPQPAPKRRRWINWQSALFAVLIFGGIGAQAYRELSKPDAWAYWRDLYVAPSLHAEQVSVDTDGSGRARRALVITGTIGPASASWLREQLDDAHLAAGDLVLLSSPGGDVSQAIIMGEVIRAHALSTAVGTPGTDGRIRPSYCASACVMAYAGGQARIGIDGSRLGVHRFTSEHPGPDPVASAQRTMGFVLSYMTKMGVSSAVVEAMSATDRIRWLSAGEASAMRLTTEQARRS